MIFIYIHVYIIHTYVYTLHVHLLYLSMHTLTRSLYFSFQSSWQNWWEGWVHLASFKQNYYLYVLLKTFFQRFAWSRESEKMHKNNYIPHIVTCIDVRIWTCIWISLPFIIFISVFFINPELNIWIQMTNGGVIHERLWPWNCVRFVDCQHGFGNDVESRFCLLELSGTCRLVTAIWSTVHHVCFPLILEHCWYWGCFNWGGVFEWQSDGLKLDGWCNCFLALCTKREGWCMW